VVDLDGGETASALVEALDRTGKVQVSLYEQQEARDLLDQGKIERVLTIPAGLTQAVAAGEAVTLRLLSDGDADPEATEAIRTTVEGAAQDLSFQAQLIASFKALADSPENQGVPVDDMVAQAQSQFERAAEAPLVSVSKTWPANLLGAEFSTTQLFAPSSTILFLFLAAQATAQSIFNEKKYGSFRRLLAAPISKATILAGKMLPNFVIVLLQVVVIFGLSMLVLPLLGLDALKLGSEPLALILVSLVVALCSTCLGVLIAGLARTESQVGGISTVALWVTALLGGAFFPSFMMGPLSDLGQALPQYWAVQAYQDILVRGQGLAGVTTELTILLGFALLFFAVGLWRFEFDA
jgi:ABC-2 type transport system permease protein